MNDLACRPCDEDNHMDCEFRSPYEPNSGAEVDLIDAIYGGPVTACCCDPRDGFVAIDE